MMDRMQRECEYRVKNRQEQKSYDHERSGYKL
jgi:hypothetical protein